MRLLIGLLVLIPCLAFADVSVVNTANYPVVPFRTNLASCTLTVTPSTNITVTSFCARDGQFLIVDVQIEWTGAGDAGVLTLNISGAPGSPVIDTAYLSGGTAVTNVGETAVGVSKVFSQGGAAWFTYFPVFKTTSTLVFTGGSGKLDGTTLASGSSVQSMLRIPIVGWR